MTTIEELKIGDKIEIELLKKQKNIIDKPIVSQVIDIKEDKVFISNPIKQGLSYILHTGQKVNIIFFREEKGVFSLTAEVLQRLALRLPVYILRPLSSPQKIQRRAYFRFKTLLKVLIRNLNEDKYIESFTKDISGGGIKIVTKKAFYQKQKVECTIFFDDIDKVTIVGEVVRVEREPISNEYQIGIRYIDITDSIRNKIIAFIFKKQRELRQKGLI